MSKDLRNRLYEYEVPPPPASWDKIATALDESHLDNQFPSTLYNLEATPPPAAWDKINEALSPSMGEKPVRRLYPILKYAAAAMLIGVLAFGGIRIFRSSTPNAPVVTRNETPATNLPSSQADPQNNVASNPTLVDPIEEERNDAALEASKHMYASLDASEKQRIKRVSEEHFLSTADPISTASDINPGNTYRDAKCAFVNAPSFAFNDDNSPIDMANRYFMLVTPDGKIIRISKKLGPIVCCVSGEETDEDCNNQLKKWREKLASPNMAASSGNFLDILNLIHTFKENNP
jgi:hypothetical protein